MYVESKSVYHCIKNNERDTWNLFTELETLEKVTEPTLDSVYAAVFEGVW